MHGQMVPGHIWYMLRSRLRRRNRRRRRTSGHRQKSAFLLSGISIVFASITVMLIIIGIIIARYHCKRRKNCSEKCLSATKTTIQSHVLLEDSSENYVKLPGSAKIKTAFVYGFDVFWDRVGNMLGTYWMTN